jgi:hypothetical protein
MNDYDEQDELGRNVTHLFKSDERKANAIISVSLEYDDIAHLEKIGREDGKTVAQVIRDAIAAYRVEQPVYPAQR